MAEGMAVSMRRRVPHAIAGLACVLAGLLALAACVPSLAPGTRECIGFPAEVCQNRVVDLEDEGQSHSGVVGYRIVCTAATCTVASGEGTETVVFGDGTGREGGFGYASAVDPPPAAGAPTAAPAQVEPECVGVPASWCTDLASSGADEVVRDGAWVASITVTCTSTCTETDGKGQTSITLSDGRVIQSDWGYQVSSGQ
jgi:hypothetical protein